MWCILIYRGEKHFCSIVSTIYIYICPAKVFFLPLEIPKIPCHSFFVPHDAPLFEVNITLIESKLFASCILNFRLNWAISCIMCILYPSKWQDPTGWWLNHPSEKYISQNGNLPQIIGVKIKNAWNHHLANLTPPHPTLQSAKTLDATSCSARHCRFKSCFGSYSREEVDWDSPHYWFINVYNKNI